MLALQTGKTALGLASRGSFIGIVDMIIKAERYRSSEQELLVNSQQCGRYHHCFYSATCNAFSGRPSSVRRPHPTPTVPIQIARDPQDDATSCQQTQKNYTNLYNVGPTSKTLSRRCINVIQMFCVFWFDTGNYSRIHINRGEWFSLISQSILTQL